MRGVLKRKVSILITVTSSTIMYLGKISREFKKQNMHFTNKCVDHLEIDIALSNSSMDIRILTQGYCVVIVSLSQCKPVS